MRCVVLTGLAASALLALPALASVGGPQAAEVLGWDPLDEKVFVAIHDYGESGEPARVIYFDLGGKSPDRAVTVSWSRSDDSTHAARMKALRRRLRPLREEAVPELPSWPAHTVVDTVADPTGLRRARFIVQGQFHYAAVGTEFEVVAYDDPSVHLAHLFAVPGRDEKVLVFSFRGIPYETGYEAQVPVVVSGRGGGRVRVEWRPSW